MKKMDEKKLKEDSGFPYGWNKGDTCVMITNKTKKSTCEYTVESYDGRYFGVRSHTGLYHRVSPWRMFRTREEAVETLLESKEQAFYLAPDVVGSINNAYPDKKKKIFIVDFNTFN